MAMDTSNGLGRPGPWIVLLPVLGAAALACGLATRPETTWAHVLLLGFFAVQLGLAGAFLVALQFLTGSGWSVALRRVPEALTALIPIGGIVVLAAQVACPALYPWMAEGFHAHGHFQHLWLTKPFFLARGVAYVVIWTLLARTMVAVSRRQDFDNTLGSTRKLQVLSALFMVVFGITATLASFDWIMSRETGWASTIYGVYHFSGLFVAGLAAVIVISQWLEWRGPFAGVFTESHRHDLGKLLFGISSFWAYVGYSDFMLIWYVNLPEETTYYTARSGGVLGTLFWVNVAVNWALPFLFLLPRSMKVGRKSLANVAALLLVGHGLDLYLSILPPTESWMDVAWPALLSLGAVAAAWAVVRSALGRASLVPIGDPYLVESLPHAVGPHPAVGEPH